MLPGLRFLFATIVLATSVLIFGLGAAALLRSAHEEFASLPSWRPAQPLLPQQAESHPTLAMLRVETLPPLSVVTTPPASAPDLAVSEDKPQNPAAHTDDAAVATDTAQAPVTDQPPPATSETLYEQAHTEPQPQSAAPPEARSEAHGAPEAITLPETTSSIGGATAGNPGDSRMPDGKAAAPKTNSGAATESAPDTKEAEASTIQSVAPQIHSTKATAALTVPAKPAARKPRRPTAAALARRRQAAQARAAARAAQQQKQNQTQSFLFGS